MKKESAIEAVSIIHLIILSKSKTRGNEKLKLRRGEAVSIAINTGASLREIAKEVGVSHEAVRLWEKYYYENKPNNPR